MNIIVAIDVTRTGNRDIALEVIHAIKQLCEPCRLTIIFYGFRAYPLLEFVEAGSVDTEYLADILSVIPALSGPSEPSIALREAVEMVLDLGLLGNSITFILWSASRRPRVPLWLQSVYAENAGLDWYLILTRPATPGWYVKVVGQHLLEKTYTIRKSTNIVKLVRRILEKHIDLSRL